MWMTPRCLLRGRLEQTSRCSQVNFPTCRVQQMGFLRSYLKERTHTTVKPLTKTKIICPPLFEMPNSSRERISVSYPQVPTIEGHEISMCLQHEILARSE